MLHRESIRDVYGQRYIVCWSTQQSGLGTITPVRTLGLGFLRRLNAPHDFWRKFLAERSFVSHLTFMRDTDVLQEINSLIKNGSIKIFRVPAQAFDQKTTLQRTFKSADDHKNYQFSYLPLNSAGSHHRQKRFQNANAARKFVEALVISPSQLSNLCDILALQIETTQAHLSTHEGLIKALSESLAEGNIVVARRPVTGPPTIKTKSSSSNENTRAQKSKRRDEPLTTQVAPVVVNDNTEKVPVCQRKSLTVSCSHGRSVILEQGVKHMPTLEVVASSVKGKNSDLITLTSDIIDICDSHKHTHISTTNDEIDVAQKEPGKVSEFKAFSQDLKIRENPVKYAWLPSIKPKTCTIYPGQTCDESKMENAGNGVVLNIYPKLAWEWKVSLGYGKDTYTFDEETKGTYKQKISSKRFGITGSVKLTQDSETFELNSEFKQAIDSTIKQIETITNLVDGIVGHFDEGRKPKVTITWPNLNLSLKTELAEGKDNYRAISFDFGISAAPFFGLNVEVDILPVIAKPLDGGIISKWLIEEAQASLKKGIGNEDGLAYLEGDVSVVMTGQGSLGFETHFKGDFSNNNSNIEKVTGKPASGKIEFKAEGKVNIKGHFLKVKVELVAGIGIKSGITLEVFIDKDEKGYYWKPEAKFSGVKAYITKYIKAKAEVGGGNRASALGKKKSPNMAVKDIKEYVWIAEKALNTDKRYFIEY